MIKKNNQIEIDESNIFKNDSLDRKELVENLSELIVSTHEPFVLSINASWGDGKTTFVKLLKAYLKKEHSVESIYFSAWEDDFSKEPLVSILGELNRYIEANFKEKSEVATKFNKAKSLSGKILKRALPALVKNATMGILDIDKGIESAISAISEESTKELIENYSKEKSILGEFQNSIYEVIKQIDSEKPFVIFVDELDRCRPLYAIELLERIKHIFGIEKLIFVLSIDKNQLSESIKSQYGNIDTDNYLRRFIDLEYQLQNPSVEKFCDMLYERFALKKVLLKKGIIINSGDFHYLEIFKILVLIFNLSLRQIEQIFTKILIVFKTIEPNWHKEHIRAAVFFEMLKSYDMTIFDNFINGKLPAEELKSLLLPKIKHRGYKALIEAIIDATNKNEEEYRELLVSKQNRLETMQEGEEKGILEHCVGLLEYSPNRYGDYKLNMIINTAIKKMEFLDRFDLKNVNQS
jgi:hypothetical protein